MTTSNGSGPALPSRCLPRNTEGQLRLDLPLQLAEFSAATRSVLALDLGAYRRHRVRRARLGLHVTLLDASAPMLDFAKRAAREGSWNMLTTRVLCCACGSRLRDRLA